MQAVPSTPLFAPTSLGLVVLLAAGLAVLALVAVVTVLLAAGRPIISLQRIKSLAAMLVLIVPALVLVGYIGVGSQTRHVERVVRPHEVRTAERLPVPVEPPVQFPSRAAGMRYVSETRPATAEAPDTSSGIQDVAGSESAVEARAEARVEVNGGAIDQSLSLPPESLTGVLKVRETGTKPPFWAGTEPVASGDGVLVPMSSQRFATLGEAEQQVTAQAVAYVRKFYDSECPLSGDWTVPLAIIEQNAVNTIVGEEFEKDFGNGVTGKMYRAHLRMDVGPALRKALHASWQDQVVSHRLMMLGGIMGVVTLMLATSTGYFWLDDATGGQYRRRLKLAAAALIAAGGLIVVVV